MAENQPDPAETALSSPEALRGARKALLIGVSQSASGWRSLPAASRDAEGLHQLLQNRDVAAFDQIKLLMNPERQRLEEEIYAIAADSQPSDLLVLYFSGHGAQDEEGRLYLTTATSRRNSYGDLIKPTAVALSFIQQILDGSPAQQQVVLLDACFTNTADSSAAIHPLDIDTQLGGSNRLVLTAADSTVYTYEQKQGIFSLYTGYLIEAIQTGTAKRAEGSVTAVDLHRYAQRKVQAAAPAIAPALYRARPDFDVALTTAPPSDARLSYRQDVEDRSQGGQTEISEFDRLILNWRRDRLGLSPETTTKIESDVLKPYQERQHKLQRYQDKLQEIVALEYPLRDTTLKGLERLRQRLGLGQEQTQAIAAQVITPHDQQYRQNLALYEHHLTRELAAGYPPTPSIRNELRYLEEQLRLRYEDVAAIQQRIVAQHQQQHQQRLADYRQRLTEAAQAGYPLSDERRQQLRQHQQQLQLSDEDVAAIEGPFIQRLTPANGQSPPAEQLSPSPTAEADPAAETTAARDDASRLQQYQQAFLSKFQPHRPLDDQSLYELNVLQTELRLKETDVAQAEAEATRQKLTDYRQKLQQYEQEFTRTAQAEPLDNPFTRSRLQQLQQDLHLAPTDVEQVEQVVLALLDMDNLLPIEPLRAGAGDRSAAESDRSVELRAVPDLPADPQGTAYRAAAASPDAATPERTLASEPVMTLPPSEAAAATHAPSDRIDRQAAADASSRGPAIGSTQTVLQTEPSRSTHLQTDPVPPRRPRSLQERLRDPETLATIGLQALKAALMAVGAILLGRLLIALMMRLMPIEMAQILGVAVFALSIILAWKALERIKLPD